MRHVHRRWPRSLDLDLPDWHWIRVGATWPSGWRHSVWNWLSIPLARFRRRAIPWPPQRQLRERTTWILRTADALSATCRTRWMPRSGGLNGQPSAVPALCRRCLPPWLTRCARVGSTSTASPSASLRHRPLHGAMQRWLGCSATVVKASQHGWMAAGKCVGAGVVCTKSTLPECLPAPVPCAISPILSCSPAATLFAIGWCSAPQSRSAFRSESWPCWRPCAPFGSFLRHRAGRAL